MKRALAGVGLSLVFVTANAGAVERQHHLGLGPSLAVLSIDDKSTASIGAGLGLHYTYGLTDQFNLMAEASAAIVAKGQAQDFPDSPRTRPAEVDHVAIGVGYVLDILRWVPYGSVMAATYRLSGGTLASSLLIPGAELGLGLDYQLSRTLAVGIAGRQHFLLTQLSTYPSYTTALLRVEYMWGW